MLRPMCGHHSKCLFDRLGGLNPEIPHWEPENIKPSPNTSNISTLLILPYFK